MTDITISKDETLEIDAIIEQSSRVNSVIGVDDRSDYNLDGFQTHTGVFNPQGTGEYNIKVNGQTLTVQVNEANAIPDEQDLYARYDLSQNNGNLPIVDQTDNGRDIDSGSFGGVGVNINGVQAGEFNSADSDSVSTSFSSSLTEPYTIVIAFEVTALSGNNLRYIDGGAINEASIFRHDFGGDDYAFDSDGGLIDSGINTDSGDIAVVSVVVNGSNSLFRVNQTEFTGTAGGSLTGYTINSRADDIDFGDQKHGESLIYDGDKSSNIADIEQYEIDKWGLSLLLNLVSKYCI